MHIFPEPFMVDHAVTVPFDNVDHGVEFDDPVVFLRHHFHRPEDWCQPEAKLYDHCDDLPDIPKKDDNRGGDPRETQYQHAHSKQIVGDLYPMPLRHIAIVDKHTKHEKDEKEVDNQCREQGNNRQKADPENHLFDKKCIGHHTVGTVRESF